MASSIPTLPLPLLLLLVPALAWPEEPAQAAGGYNAAADVAAAASSSSSMSESSQSSVSEQSSSSSASSSSSMTSEQSEAGDIHHDMHEDTVPRLHPEHNEYAACKYQGEWGDCDPFKMIKIKEQRLMSGGSSCQMVKNITKPCSREDFPPGTLWLLKEHKLCVMELQKLKSMIEDLHRYIDLIHQRGQALFNAYNDLKKRLMDMRREISVISRRNHDAEQTVTRLRVEMDDWKTKSNKMQMELNELQAQYKEMENKVRIPEAVIEYNY